MIRLLQFLFTGHVHKWKTVEKVTLWGSSRDMPIGSRWIQECEHCGKVVRRDLT